MPESDSTCIFQLVGQIGTNSASAFFGAGQSAKRSSTRSMAQPSSFQTLQSHVCCLVQGTVALCAGLVDSHQHTVSDTEYGSLVAVGSAVKVLTVFHIMLLSSQFGSLMVKGKW